MKNLSFSIMNIATSVYFLAAKFVFLCSVYVVSITRYYLVLHKKLSTTEAENGHGFFFC